MSRSDPLDPQLRVRLEQLMEAGRDIFDRFDLEVRQREFHPFVPADYDPVLDMLIRLRQPGQRFLEWGSGTGVITIMADMLGYEAYGIEIDEGLVRTARELAQQFGSGARFVAGSFLPAGYRWRSSTGDQRLGTIGEAPSGYYELGHGLDDFDIVYVYPWSGEEPMMHDLMRQYGGPDARLVVNSGTAGLMVYRRGRREF